MPTFGAYFFKKGSSAGAIAAMLGGGMVNLILQAQVIKLPPSIDAWGFDPCVYGILASFILYKEFSLLMPDSEEDTEAAKEK